MTNLSNPATDGDDSGLTVSYKTARRRSMFWPGCSDAQDAIKKTAEAECIAVDDLDVINVTDESGEEVWSWLD